MEKKTYSILIDAPKEKVWETLWSEDTYPKWTSYFSEGSIAKSDWNQGSKIYFLDGKENGMIGIIEKKIPNEFISFKFIGEISEGVEDYESEKVKAYSGAHEDYTLTEVDGKTKVEAVMDIQEEYLDFMEKVWPQALNKLKEMSES